jgi:hypothetical protein
MTDRINYLTVALKSDTRDDDCEALINAIRQLRGVLKVEPNVADGNSWTSDARTKRELGDKLWEVLFTKVGK